MTENSRSLLRPSATTVVETDMTVFEGALGEKWCHIWDQSRGRNLCGTPKIKKPRPPHSSPPGPVCEGCGLRTCPDCLRIRYERWGRP